MRRYWWAMLSVCLVLGLTARSQAQDDPKEIIKKAIAASGGADKIDKFKGAKSSGKGTIMIMGLELEYTSESVYMFPDKSKETIKMEVMGQTLTIEQKHFDGKFTMSLNGAAQELPDAMKNEMKQALVLESIQRLTPLLSDTGFKLKSLGASKIDGKDVNGVGVEGKGLKEVKLFFDKSTGLMFQAERKGLDPTGQMEIKQVMKITEYKEVNGVKKPWKLAITNDGEKFLDSTTTKLELVEKIDDKEFAD